MRTPNIMARIGSRAMNMSWGDPALPGRSTEVEGHQVLRRADGRSAQGRRGSAARAQSSQCGRWWTRRPASTATAFNRSADRPIRRRAVRGYAHGIGKRPQPSMLQTRPLHSRKDRDGRAVFDASKAILASRAIFWMIRLILGVVAWGIHHWRRGRQPVNGLRSHRRSGVSFPTCRGG
jgi:hypothetical protein